MKNEIINTAVENQKKAALHVGHQVLIVDQLLKVDSDGYQVRLSVGWETPQGTIMPSASIIMPIPFAAELSSALSNAVNEGNKMRDKKQ